MLKTGCTSFLARLAGLEFPWRNSAEVNSLSDDQKGIQTMKYKIMIRHSEEGYSVSVPGLPGCWSQGATEEEAIENIRDAIQEYLAAINDLFPDAEIREIDVAV